MTRTAIPSWCGLLVIAIATVGCSSSPAPEPVTSAPSPTSLTEPTVETTVQSEASAASWREDLQALATGMQEIHPDLFWRVSEPDFRSAVDQLDGQIPGLTDDEVIVELARIASLVDGHTHLPLFQPNVGFRRYPIRLYRFSDGLFIVDAPPDLAGHIGSKVTAIGATDIDQAFGRVAPLVPRDNAMTVELLTPVYLTIPEVLAAMGVVTDIDEPGFVVENAAGESVVLDMAPLPPDADPDWTSLFTDLAGLPQRPEPMSLQNLGEHFWYTILEDGDTLYVQYNRVQDTAPDGTRLADMIDEIEVQLAEGTVRRIVIDIRHNPGGNINTAAPLVELLTNSEIAGQTGNLFVITGRHTFSAATLFAVDLERNTEAIFAGEATGGRPNLYGDPIPVVLPNSGISVMVSGRYWERSDPDDVRDALEPAIPVPLSSADFFLGRDPVLDAVLSRAP